MLDESLLDSPEALARVDRDALLRGTAEAGARVRSAIRLADEVGLDRLSPEGRPRAVLVAGQSPTASCVADLLDAMGGGALPVTLVRPTGPLGDPDALRWALPGWAGPMDLLLLASCEGHEPGLALLVEQAYRRGCTVVTVCPPEAPLAEAARQARGLPVPLARTPLEAEGVENPADARRVSPGALWALLTPLLVLGDRVGLVSAPPKALQALADRLDSVAERCGPAQATYDNPAKALAAELADAVPVLWSEGELAGAAARHAATLLTGLAGRPTLTARLPEALVEHPALLSGTLGGGQDPEDFFRDRVEEPEPLRVHVVLVREGPPDADSPSPAARELAYARETALTELEPAEGLTPLEGVAELIATLDFAAVYLTLAGRDPS
ncbi:SIS domain-containing protein [Streptomyces sp. NPDC005438]|uniref:SIS domain-containing protein n=1 Tax=Streptomyces sp. NPDC005438 TaxID=3156880 RepID=UPI0033AA0426